MIASPSIQSIYPHVHVLCLFKLTRFHHISSQGVNRIRRPSHTKGQDTRLSIRCQTNAPVDRDLSRKKRVVRVRKWRERVEHGTMHSNMTTDRSLYISQCPPSPASAGQSEPWRVRRIIAFTASLLAHSVSRDTRFCF
jgi:hypothetical protein